MVGVGVNGASRQVLQSAAERIEALELEKEHLAGEIRREVVATDSAVEAGERRAGRMRRRRRSAEPARQTRQIVGEARRQRRDFVAKKLVVDERERPALLRGGLACP